MEIIIHSSTFTNTTLCGNDNCQCDCDNYCSCDSNDYGKSYCDGDCSVVSCTCDVNCPRDDCMMGG